MPRRLTVAVPVAPFDTVEFWPANTIGKLLRMSSVRVRLVAEMYPASTLVIGLIAVRFGEVRREPVTTISSRPDVSLATAGAICDHATGTMALAAAAESAARTPNCT